MNALVRERAVPDTRRQRTPFPRALLVLLPLAAGSGTARAQTAYQNTDAGRPLQVEDAYAIDRYSLDLHVAPVTLERSGGANTLRLEPALAYGLVPRTQINLSVPLTFRGPADRARFGVAGVALSALYHFNVETRGLPAFALRATAQLPAGQFGPSTLQPVIRGIATRTFSHSRVHVNAAYTWKDEPAIDTAMATRAGATEPSRWMAGVAVDHTFPLRALLLTAEAYAAEPRGATRSAAWTLGGGARYQLDPYISLDAGLGARLTGDDQAWFLTFGVARVVGVKALMPGRGAWGR